MGVYAVGLAGVIFFYLCILATGIWAAIKKKKSSNKENAERGETIDKTEDVLLAGRNLGLIVGTVTTTATWVGGGFINGTSESTFERGLIWVQGPWGYAISLALGGMLFAKKMRAKKYVTMIDPFQEKYGPRMGGFMYIPALLGEIFWSGAILGSLGGSICVVIDVDYTQAVAVSTIFSVAYTFIGGLYSVAYTDLVQLSCIFVGMWLAIPFAMTNRVVKNISTTKNDWQGTLNSKMTGVWVDKALLLIFGGIPWQVYFQKVLACKTVKQTRYQSCLASVCCFVMAIPPALFGAIAASTDWRETDYDKLTPNGTLRPEDASRVLPLVLQYLTPPVVTFIALGAVSAATMASADSSILSASSMFARNIYKAILRPQASERETVIVVRVSVCCVGALAATMALEIRSIYGLWALAADFVYAILFPQLCCVIYFQNVNTYGASMGYILALIMRLGGGEELIGLKPFIKYPHYNETHGQLFPFRTFTMLCSLLTIVLVSCFTRYLFHSKVLPRKLDVFECFESDYQTAFSSNNELSKTQPDETSYMLAGITHDIE